ncbi:hypothetical protein ACS0TY_023692 [Phlomoides rotata]
MEEILYELERNERNDQGLPPGFRFHPTDEELITFYLASKVFNGSFCGVEIAEVDLNRCEPWELPDVAKMGEREWYFFSLRDRKYPTGLRTNRATSAGYWKATGKDREVYSASTSALLGMKKTLVFYKGRAPRGEKTKWVMHEYRLDGDFSCRHTGKEEWVICRIFHKMAEKKTPTSLIMLQGQNYLIKSNPNPNPNPFPNSLPPLLEPPPESHPSIMQTLNQNQNPFLTHTHESDLKTLINPLDHHFQPNLPHPTSSFSNKDDSILFKPFISNQDFTLKDLSNAIAKQCKREPDFGTHFQLLSNEFGNMRWGAERIEEEEEDARYQNSFAFGGGMGIPSPTVDNNNNVTMDAIDHVMSTEPAFKWW